MAVFEEGKTRVEITKTLGLRSEERVKKWVQQIVGKMNKSSPGRTLS